MTQVSSRPLGYAMMARRLSTSSLTSASAIAGVLAGAFQAIGLLRWVQAGRAVLALTVPEGSS